MKNSISIFALKNGDKITNQYGNTLTVLEVVGNSIRVYEESTYYHHSKVFFNGKSIVFKKISEKSANKF